MSYDDWKTTEPEDRYSIPAESIGMRCKQCREQFERDDASDFTEDDGEISEHVLCPNCGSDRLETIADYEERLRDQYYDQQLQAWKDGDIPLNGRYRGQ